MGNNSRGHCEQWGVRPPSEWIWLRPTYCWPVLQREMCRCSIHDVNIAAKLIREDDDVVYSDSGYWGLPKRPEIQENEHKSKIDYRINRHPSQIKTADAYTGINWEKKIEHDKSSIRSKVEHVLLIVKRDFGYKKVAYRGLEKNLNRLYFLFASANILMYLRGGH